LIDDDGVTNAHTANGEYTELRIWMSTRPGEPEVRVGLEIVHAGFTPEFKTVWVVVGSDERRVVVVEGVKRPKRKVGEGGKEMTGIPIGIPISDSRL